PRLGFDHARDAAGRRKAGHLSAAARAAEGHERGEAGERAGKTRDEVNREKDRQKDVEEDRAKTVGGRSDGLSPERHARFKTKKRGVLQLSNVRAPSNQRIAVQDRLTIL